MSYSFLQNMGSSKRERGNSSKCKCLQILQDTIDDEDTDTSDTDSVHVCINKDMHKSVALYMMWFFKLKNNHREQIIIDWIHYTEHERVYKNHKRFFLPFINTASSNKDAVKAWSFVFGKPNGNLICTSTLKHLLDILLFLVVSSSRHHDCYFYTCTTVNILIQGKSVIK